MPHRPLEDDLRHIDAYNAGEQHDSGPDGYAGIECDDCGEKFKSFSAFKRHLPGCPGP